MPVYNPNAPQIPLPTKLAEPILVGGSRPAQRPYNRVQAFSSLLPPDGFSDKWRLVFLWQYGQDYTTTNKLFNFGVAEADEAEGPYEITLDVSMPNQDAFPVYYDNIVNPPRYRGAGISVKGESPNLHFWDTKPFTNGKFGPMSIIRHQPFSAGNGLPFIVTVRDELVVNGVALRRVAFKDSSDFVTFSGCRNLPQFDTTDNGLTQPYGLMLTSYGNKIVGLLQHLELDQTPISSIPSSNSIGKVSAELIWCEPSPTATQLSGLTWNRTYTPFLTYGGSGAFDEGMAMPCSMVIHEDTVYIPYTAQREKHGVVPAPGNMTIGLATMPKSELDEILDG